MSKEGVLSVNSSGAAVIETLSSEGGPHTPPMGHNFNFSGSIAGGSAANGAIEFITPGGPGAATDGQMDAVVRTDGVTIDINASNELHVIGGVFSEEFTVDAHTAPGTNPVVPDGGGNVNITGGQVAAGTTANVIRTDSLAANSYTIEVQRSQAAGVSTIGDNGVSHFNSSMFSVDGNGFVSLSGGGQAIDSIGVQTGTNPIVPTVAGLVTINGAVVAAGTNPVRTDGTGANTMAVEVQVSQALAATDATKIGLSNFDSARFTVDANGFVSTSGTGIIDTLTGNTGGAIAPVAGNINTVGTGSITTAGSGNTLTTQLTGLTNHAVLVGAGTATITKFAPTATAGQVLQSAGAAADPAFSTATYPSTTTANDILYSSATNVVGQISTVNQAVLTTGTGGVPVLTSIATNGQLIIGSTAGAPAAATLTAGTGITITNASNSITIAASGSVVGETITGDTGGALSPTAGNWNINAGNSSQHAGSSVSFSGSGSTLTFNDTDSNQNVIMGLGAGNGTLSGQENTGVGRSVFSALTNASANTAFGWSSLQHATTDLYNCGFGAQALQTLVGSVGHNTAVGTASLNALITGQDNTCLGYFAGAAYVGAESSNILIGSGVQGTAAESNVIRIGTTGSGNQQQNKCFIAGITGVTASNAQLVTINSSTGQLGVTTSDIFTWNVVSSNQTGTTNNGYIFVAAGGALTISLPTTSSVGDMFRVVLDGATSWQITQALGQQIRLASATTTSGATGSLTSTAQGNAVTLVCRVANTTWTAVSSIGNITVA